jgi:hypothetical protein
MKILLFILFPFIIFGSTFFIDNYASFKGDGTINSPFNSLDQAFNKIQPGDTLILRGSNCEYGQIYITDLELPMSGLESSPIVVMPFKNEQVVISIHSKFQINKEYWLFERIIFEDLNLALPKTDISVKTIKFKNCIFRGQNLDEFEIAAINNNIFEFCEIQEIK